MDNLKYMLYIFLINNCLIKSVVTTRSLKLCPKMR